MKNVSHDATSALSTGSSNSANKHDAGMMLRLPILTTRKLPLLISRYRVARLMPSDFAASLGDSAYVISI